MNKKLFRYYCLMLFNLSRILNYYYYLAKLVKCVGAGIWNLLWSIFYVRHCNCTPLANKIKQFRRKASIIPLFFQIPSYTKVHKNLYTLWHFLCMSTMLNIYNWFHFEVPICEKAFENTHTPIYCCGTPP